MEAAIRVWHTPPIHLFPVKPLALFSSNETYILREQIEAPLPELLKVRG